MARTRRSDYLKSNHARALRLSDPAGARGAAARLLAAPDASTRQSAGEELLAILARQAGIAAPELIVPDDNQPHRRAGGRIVFSLQGEYRRRAPSAADPAVARGGRPIGRIRILNRTPARGHVVRASAFLHTLLHEFCHHHDAEAFGLLRSFHTAGFYARVRHLRDQVEADAPAAEPSPAPGAAPPPAPASTRGEAPRAPWRPWSIIRRR